MPQEKSEQIQDNPVQSLKLNNSNPFWIPSGVNNDYDYYKHSHYIAFPTIFKNNVWEWDISAYKPSKRDLLVLEYKELGSAKFTTYKCEIRGNELQMALSPFGTINIYENDGKKFLKIDENNNYAFGSLQVKSIINKKNNILLILDDSITIGLIEINSKPVKLNYPLKKGTHKLFAAEKFDLSMYVSALNSISKLTIISSNKSNKISIYKTGKQILKDLEAPVIISNFNHK